MTVIPLKVEHFAAMAVQPAQAFARVVLEDPEVAPFLAAQESFTAMDGDLVLGCGGVLKQWEGRLMAWALLGTAIGTRRMLWIHNRTRFFLRDQLKRCRRIETTVDSEFPEGHRWVRALGFRCETPDGMPGYRPDGGSSHLYAMVR